MAVFGAKPPPQPVRFAAASGGPTGEGLCENATRFVIFIAYFINVLNLCGASNFGRGDLL